MFKDKIEKLDKLIAQCDYVDFAEKKDWNRWGLIEQAERKMGVKLPESYKWWVNFYKFGSIGFDQEICTIYEETLGIISASNLVVNYLKRSENSVITYDSGIKFFSAFSGDELYYFEIVHGEPEYEVYVYDPFGGGHQYYASNFVEFLIKFIEITYPTNSM